MFTLMIVTKGKIEVIKSIKNSEDCFSYLYYEFVPDYEKSNCYIEFIEKTGEVSYALIKFLPELYIYMSTLDKILEEIEG